MIQELKNPEEHELVRLINRQFEQIAFESLEATEESIDQGEIGGNNWVSQFA